MHYERRKHDGTLPMIGVNTFLSEQCRSPAAEVALIRSTDEEKDSRSPGFKDSSSAMHRTHPQRCRLQQVATSGGNVFAELIKTVGVFARTDSHAFYESAAGIDEASQLGGDGGLPLRVGSGPPAKGAWWPQLAEVWRRVRKESASSAPRRPFPLGQRQRGSGTKGGN